MKGQHSFEVDGEDDRTVRNKLTVYRNKNHTLMKNKTFFVFSSLDKKEKVYNIEKRAEQNILTGLKNRTGVVFPLQK
jgi:hypothetical protein